MGKILEEGDTNSKGYKVKALQVDGGTGYAVQMAINLGKPVYVFDLNYNVWMKYNPEGLVDSDIPGQKGRFDQTDTPVLTKKFAGVGTREINEAGKQAIRDVYKNTASQAPTQPTETSISPKPEATIDTDMNVYKDLLAKNNGVQPQTFTSEDRMYRLNKFGNYDLVDDTTGEIYLRNINMETGKQETEPGLDAPVDPEVIDKALDRLITLRATTNIEEQLAERGYDIVDIINNLAEAKTQEDYNKITKILDKLC